MKPLPSIFTAFIFLAQMTYADDLPKGAVARLGTLAFRTHHTTAAVAYSKDGRLVVSASWDRFARVWDAATGKELHRFPLGESGTAVAISPDGALLAAGNMKRTMILFDLKAGKEIDRVADNANSVFFLRFTADGSRLAWLAGNAVRVYDLKARREIHRITGEKDDIRPVAISDDATRLAFGKAGHLIRVFDLTTGNEIKSIDAPGNLSGLAFDSTATRLAGGVGGVLTVWDVNTGQPVAQKEAAKDLHRMLFIENDATIATAAQDGMVRLWSAKDASAIGQFNVGVRNDLWVMSLAVSPDGQTLATGCTDKAIRLWKIMKGKVVGPPLSHGDEITSAVFINGGKHVATASQDGAVYVWDAGNGELLDRVNPKPMIGVNIAASADGSRFVLADENPRVGIYDGVSRKLIAPFGDDLVAMYNVTMSADGALVAAGCRHDHVKVLDAKTGMERARVKLNPRQFVEVPKAFSPDGAILALGAGDHDRRFCTLHDSSSGELIGRIDAWAGGNHGLAWSPDGTVLAVANYKKPIEIWETASLTLRVKFEGDADAGTCVAFSRDGRWLAAGGGPDKATIRVWHVPTGKQVGKFTGHMHWIKSVAFSPDGKRLVSASEDTTAIVWDISTLSPGEIAPKETSLETQWAALADPAAAAAYPAMLALTADTRAAEFIAARIVRPANVDREAIMKLVTALDGETYKQRQQAQEALERLGPAIASTLAELRKSAPGEAAARIDTILARFARPGASSDSIREIRAVEVLGWMQAKEALAKLAKDRGDTAIGKVARRALRAKSVEAE